MDPSSPQGMNLDMCPGDTEAVMVIDMAMVMDIIMDIRGMVATEDMDMAIAMDSSMDYVEAMEAVMAMDMDIIEDLVMDSLVS